MQLDALYQEIILDHYRNPHHAGLAEPYDVEVHHVNPSCGDEVTLRVSLDGDVVTGVTHQSAGCSISQAATSVMTDLVIGKPVADGMATYEKFLELMQGRGTVEPDEDVLEDGVAFAGVAQFPARVKCALLGWSAWRDVTEALKDVVDPELGINVVDLGLVYGVTLDADETAVIDMTLTSAACPLTDVIEDQTRTSLDGLVDDFRINWVWMPPWGPEKITEEGRDQLRALGFNV